MMNSEDQKPKLNKAQLLHTLKGDLQAAQTVRKTVDEDISRRRGIYRGDKYGNEEKDKSQIVPKVAKRQQAWAHPSLKQPFVSGNKLIKFSPITFEDTKAAEQNELLLNFQFCREFDRYNFITKALKVLEVDATLFVQVGWEYEEQEVEQEVDIPVYDDRGVLRGAQSVTELVTIPTVNRPTAKVCRSEDIFLDPTCEDNLDKAQFVIYRYESDLSTLRTEGRYKNLDKVSATMGDDSDYVSEDVSNFRFNDEPRKKFVVYEYWGNYDINNDGIAEAIVCTWVNDVIIRLEDNPYPDKKVPFLSCPAESVPFQLYGENDIDAIEDQQQVITAVTRGIINNMSASNNGQVGIRKGALDPIQKKKMMAGKSFEFNTSPNDIWQGSYNSIPNSAFNMLSMMNGEVDSLTGTKGFSGGITGGSLGSSATAARGVLDATAVRRLDKVRNIAENLVKPLVRKWMQYNSKFLSEEEVVRVTNTDFVKVAKKDLSGRVDMSIAVSTPEDDAAKRSELSFLLQTIGNSMPLEMTQIILSDIARLNDMPELEKKLSDFKQEPDKRAEEIQELQKKKLEMDIAKTKAEIQKIFSESIENKEGDLLEKAAQAKHLDAQTRLLDSKVDMEDLKFIKMDNQEDEQFEVAKMKLRQKQEAELELLRAKFNAVQMKQQQNAGDTNIGVM